MERKIIESIKEYVNYLENVYEGQLARADDLKEYDLIRLKAVTKPNGKTYYFCQTPDAKPKADHKSKAFKYLGPESCEEVALIKEARYYKHSLPAIQTNLKVCLKLLDRFRFTDYDSINEVIPRAYKDASLRISNAIKSPQAVSWKEEKEAFKASCDPWYPEDLKVTTADKSMVRSKSEGMIYNQYLSLGATFVYELPIRLKSGIVRHPDFTVLSEADWASFILHDHQGMYGHESDRKRYNDDMYLYWQNGFIPGVNIFYTFDDPRGGFDISVVNNIMDTKIRPKH